jgi:hypothetical protein
MEPISLTIAVLAGIGAARQAAKNKRDAKEIAENRDLQRRADAIIDALDRRSGR